MLVSIFILIITINAGNFPLDGGGKLAENPQDMFSGTASYFEGLILVSAIMAVPLLSPSTQKGFFWVVL